MFRLRGPVAHLALGVLLLTLAGGIVGCRTLNGPCNAPTLTVTPASVTLAAGQTQQFTATLRDASGNIVGGTITWSVVSGGGSINSAGLFTAGSAAGTFTRTVRAVSDSTSASATVVVVAAAGPLASITVTPNPATMSTGAQQQFVAVGKDAQGVVVSITPSWSVVASGGSIASGGLFTAGATAGTFTNTVRATSGSISGTATVVVSSAPGGPSFGSAAAFGSLGGVTITNTGPTHIEGDIGTSPGNSVTGFPPGTVSGTIHLADGVATQAQLDLTTAYNAVAAAVCTHDLSTQDLGARTLTPGVYCFSAAALMTGTLTLDGQGDANAIFMFQIGSALTTAPNAMVLLVNGAQARNIYWQIGSSATLGTGTAFKGNLLAFSSVTMNTGATLVGRAFARNAAVSFDTNMVTLP